MAEAKQSRCMVLRNNTRSSSMSNQIKSSNSKSERSIGGDEDIGNQKMSTSHKDALNDENLKRKSISVASKSELIRGLTTDKRLHIISTENYILCYRRITSSWCALLLWIPLPGFLLYAAPVAHRAKAEFSPEDDLAIIRFLLKSNRYMKVNKRETWLKMSSEKVTRHSWLKMKDRYAEVIQPIIDKYPISETEADKLRSSSSNDMRKTSLKYQLRSASSDGNSIPVTENFSKRSDEDDYSWSPVKRRCRSDGQCSSPEKATNLTSGSDDFVADAAVKAQPKFKRMKTSNLQLKVVNLGSEKFDIKRKTVLKQQTKISKMNEEEVSDVGQKAKKLADVRLRVAFLSDDVTSNESAEERLKTPKKEEKNGNCISSLSRNRRARKSKMQELTESDLQPVSNHTDTSVSEEIFSADETHGRSKVSSRLPQPSKDKVRSPTTAATSAECNKPAALPLANGESDRLHTNFIKNFVLSDSPVDNCIEVNNTEATEDLTVENNEIEQHLLVCQKLMIWLNISPEVFAQAILMNSGNVDDGVHWLLFNKTASGDAVWDPKDDKDLLNGDEEVYKSLEQNYGEMLILKRQQFLATNSSSLHV